MRWIARIGAVLAVCAGFLAGGCSSADDDTRIASKTECIPEVARRLLACAEERGCEQGVARYAGYCYNTAEGSQMDICRGGQYFFEQPLNELNAAQPELMGRLNKRQREIIVRTGEAYCVYNSN